LLITPATPATTDLINFIAPADGEGGVNACWASAQYGTPLISVDPNSRIVTVTFSPPPAEAVCPFIVALVSGVDGQFGPLNPGTWTFKILTNSYTFTVNKASSSRITVTNNGSGKVTPNLNGRTLAIGPSYTLTARAGAGWSFSNWSGSISADTNPLTFFMQSNMVIQANFTPGPFVAVQGLYNGLFYPANGLSAETAGMLRDLALGPQGAYSGRLLLDGWSWPFSGIFTPSGRATNRISSRADWFDRQFTLEMSLNLTVTPPQITGVVSATFKRTFRRSQRTSPLRKSPASFPPPMALAGRPAFSPGAPPTPVPPNTPACWPRKIPGLPTCPPVLAMR
jgi:hypothetical protein